MQRVLEMKTRGLWTSFAGMDRIKFAKVGNLFEECA